MVAQQWCVVLVLWWLLNNIIHAKAIKWLTSGSYLFVSNLSTHAAWFSSQVKVIQAVALKCMSRLSFLVCNSTLHSKGLFNQNPVGFSQRDLCHPHQKDLKIFYLVDSHLEDRSSCGLCRVHTAWFSKSSYHHCFNTARLSGVAFSRCCVHIARWIGDRRLHTAWLYNGKNRRQLCLVRKLQPNALEKW